MSRLKFGVLPALRRCTPNPLAQTTISSDHDLKRDTVYAATEFTPVASALGGAVIGLSAVLLMYVSGRIAGVSGILRRMLWPDSTSRPLEAAAFILGLVLAPVAWTLVTAQPVLQTVSDNLGKVAIAGLLVGVGTTLANGCTSGHGVCGLSRLSVRSIIATGIFMLAAVITVYLTRHVMGI